MLQPGHFGTYSSMSLLISGQYTHSRALLFMLSAPVWPLWSSARYNWRNFTGIIALWPFMMTPFMIVSSSLYPQYGLIVLCQEFSVYLRLQQRSLRDCNGQPAYPEQCILQRSGIRSEESLNINVDDTYQNSVFIWRIQIPQCTDAIHHLMSVIECSHTHCVQLLLLCCTNPDSLFHCYMDEQ